jgi:hypothetical protein
MERHGVEAEESEWTIHESVQSENLASAGESDQFDLTSIARFEANSGPRWDIETESPRECAIEPQPVVHFEEVKMAAYLYRPITGVRDLDNARFEIGVREKWCRCVCDDNLTRDHARYRMG